MQPDTEPLFERVHTVLELYPASDPHFLDKLQEQRWAVEAIEALSSDQKMKTIAAELVRELTADPPASSARDLHLLTERLECAHEQFTGAIKPALSLASTQAAFTLICTISALLIGNTGIVNFVKSLSEYFVSPLARGVQFGGCSSSNCTEVCRWPMDQRQGFTRSPRPCGGGSIW